MNSYFPAENFREVTMGVKFVTAVVASLFAVCNVVAQTSVAANAAIDGVWRGKMNGVPVMTLVVTDEPGKLTGAVLFYFRHRTTEKDPWITEPRLPEPIFDVQYDGKTLLFETSHRRAHPPQSLSDRPMHYRMTLNGPNTGEIVNLDEPGSPVLKLDRSDY
jgi:hypothetical protein